MCQQLQDEAVHKGCICMRVQLPQDVHLLADGCPRRRCLQHRDLVLTAPINPGALLAAVLVVQDTTSLSLNITGGIADQRPCIYLHDAVVGAFLEPLILCDGRTV